MEPDESAKEGGRAPVHVGDDINIKDGVDAVTNTIETTTLTTATLDYPDGFLKLFTGCAGARSKLPPEDTETYGFLDMETRERVMIERQNNAITTLNNTTTVSSGTHSVPVSMNARMSNNLGRHDDTRTAHNTGTQQGQTSIHSHQTTMYRQKDATILDPDVYQFTFPERGYMVNIVNDRFTHQPKRDGAQYDLYKMEEIGRKFGFRLFNYKNLPRNETRSLLRNIQLADHSNCDCFMFIISTHGLEQPNPALHGKLDHALSCADDQLIFTSSILDVFSDRNCPTLRGKPKIFFVQACRGEQVDHGSDVFVVNTQPVDRTDQTVFSDQKPKRHNKQESVDEYDTLPGQDSWTQDHGEENVRYRPTATGNSNNKYTTTATATLAAGAPQSYGGQPQYYAAKQSQFPTTVTATMAASAPQYYRGQPQFCAPKQSQFPTAASITNQYTATKVPLYPGTSATEWLRPYPIVDTPSLRCSNDMLVMYAIPQGMYAWRSAGDGSWMIHYLHQVLMSHNMKSPKSFLSLLTKVSFFMSQRSTDTPEIPEMHKKKAIPVIEHKLDKDIVFQPKIKGSEWV